jgi:thiamine-monophosphate kinase
MSAPDEFEAIARLFRPLTRGAPEALGLSDDAAAITARPGLDLVVTTDTLVEGVHVPAGEAADLVARKLLRVNLSDLAAKAAEPFGYFLNVSWPAAWDGAARERFAAGLAEDGERFGLVLLGGDTTGTPGPMTASVTMLGYVPAGGMVRRSGAKPGDLVMVSGPIAGWELGLAALRGEIDAPALARRYRLPEPRLDLREALRAHASAAADISDGLIADARHIAQASGVQVRLALERVPVPAEAGRWLESQADRAAARLALASGGDDYEIVCTAPPDAARALGLTAIGEVTAGEGVLVTWEGSPMAPGAGGWRHR